MICTITPESATSTVFTSAPSSSQISSSWSRKLMAATSLRRSGSSVVLSLSQSQLQQLRVRQHVLDQPVADNLTDLAQPSAEGAALGAGANRRAACRSA